MSVPAPFFLYTEEIILTEERAHFFSVHNRNVTVNDDRSAEPGGLKPRGRLGRWLAPAITLVIAVALGITVAVVPLPYVIYSPGPTYDVLGSQNDTPILEVEGAQSDGTGQLRMVTISELGGPGSSVTAPTLARALFSGSHTIKRYSEVYPEDMSVEDLKTISATQMQSSHSTSSVAALRYLDYEMPTVITIIDSVEGSGAAGKLESGDQLVSLKAPGAGAVAMDTPDAPFAFLRTVPAGTELDVTVLRDGKEVTETVKTMADPASDGEDSGSKLGIILDFDIDMPLDIVVHLESVGGPSAGMIFALGIIDELTDGDLTGGMTIAGTGSITYDGQIEPIGGVKQKMHAALRDGAEWFLAPARNCDSVVGNIPNGLSVAAVGTLEEAVTAVESIVAGEGDSVMTCEAVLAAQ